ncbi:MAG: TetR/AcrR family transcriptional regulator [Alphaproteobacteria bacterium]|nr:TetR/AcrR family transcriptional regulator [Alphaproteobacteria bacterium]
MIPVKRAKRLPASERRAQIVAVARDLFTSEGIERTSMRAIAARAGITATAIYDHFPDKAALLRAIADQFFMRLIEAIASALDAGSDPAACFRNMAHAYVRCGLENPDEYRLVFMTPIVQLGKDDGFKHWSNRPEEETPGTRSFAMLESLIARLMEAGYLAKADIRTTAEMLWACVHGIVALLITHRDVDFSHPDALVDTLVRTFGQGLTKSRPPGA